MTKKRRLRGCPKLSPYARLENELHNSRVALAEAAEAYVAALQALSDLLAYYDHPPSGWSHADAKKIARIRAIADGNSPSYSRK